MTAGNTATLSFPIEPSLNVELRTAAEQEHRFIGKKVEVLFRDNCERNGIAIPEQGALFDDSQKSACGER